MRINKYIALHTGYSRRKADELIAENRVTVNNLPARPGTDITPQDTILIDGTPLDQKEEYLYLALHKPEGFVCTRSDEQNRRTIMELLPPVKNLKPVGRLDKDSEGLILASNDGEFINRHTHPRHQREKEYQVVVEGNLSIEKAGKLEKGIALDGRLTAPARIFIHKKTPQTTSLTIILREGRNRQIRRMCSAMGHPVKYLKRVRIGAISLGTLHKGSYRPLTKKELHA